MPSSQGQVSRNVHTSPTTSWTVLIIPRTRHFSRNNKPTIPDFKTDRGPRTVIATQYPYPGVLSLSRPRPNQRIYSLGEPLHIPREATKHCFTYPQNVAPVLGHPSGATALISALDKHEWDMHHIKRLTKPARKLSNRGSAFLS